MHYTASIKLASDDELQKQLSYILGSGLHASFGPNQNAADDGLQKQFSSILGSGLDALHGMN